MSASKSRVLIVEDNTPLRNLMADVLKLEGYTVIEAFDAPSMRQCMVTCQPKNAGESFDLIITDIQMPGESGMVSLQALRHMGCRIPAVIVTAFPELATLERAIELQATLLPKPFSLGEFRSVAAAVLRPNRCDQIGP